MQQILLQTNLCCSCMVKKKKKKKKLRKQGGESHHLVMPLGTPSPPGKKPLFQPLHMGKHHLLLYILILSVEENIPI